MTLDAGEQLVGNFILIHGIFKGWFSNYQKGKVQSSRKWKYSSKVEHSATTLYLIQTLGQMLFTLNTNDYFLCSYMMCVPNKYLFPYSLN